MRVSTKSFQMQWLNSFTLRQQNLLDIQRQVSSGRRVATAADDPVGAAQMTLLQQGLDRLDNYAANADTARRRLSLSEGALSEAADLVNRVRELAIQAGGAAQTPETRQALANEAREIYRNLLDIANTQDGEGRYLFAGNRVHSLPFIENGATVTYTGDDGGRSQRIGDNRVVAEGNPGSEVFQAIRNGNGTFAVSAAAGNSGTAFFTAASVLNPAAWPASDFTINFTAPDAFEVRNAAGTAVLTGSYSPGDSIAFAGISISFDGTPAAGDSFQVSPSQNQDLFTTIRNFIATMEGDLSSQASRAQVQSQLNASLLDMDRALDKLGEVRASVGSRLAVIDQQVDNNQELGLQFTQTLSLLRDVDYASAISELEQQMIGLEAAQRSFARTRSFSLFQLL
ncbi:MAG: flagellar hook-associated protein 3 [Gammaproteobacteria bacterium]|nr:MAG: flagellar hook-associated protein 3 [Gammaproteobacteria bacterium]